MVFNISVVLIANAVLAATPSPPDFGVVFSGFMVNAVNAVAVAASVVVAVVNNNLLFMVS